MYFHWKYVLLVMLRLKPKYADHSTILLSPYARTYYIKALSLLWQCCMSVLPVVVWCVQTSTQYLHQYRFENRHKGRSALPLHNTTAIRQILQTRQAEEFSDQVEKQKTRLEHALAVRESYDKDVLKFMRFAALAVDMARYCGNTCTKTTSDVLKVCREFKGYL